MSRAIQLLGAALAAVVAAAVGCTVDVRDRGMRGPVQSGSPDGQLAPDPKPAMILARVDTGKTMSAPPGDGVGIFIEYATGGAWHLWWTCDTRQTGESCVFDLSASVDTGQINNPREDSTLTGDANAALSASPTLVAAASKTTLSAHGVRFETVPGAVITLDARIGGERSGKYFFFVQNGVPNGGYDGSLSDPLMLQGTTP